MLRFGLHSTGSEQCPMEKSYEYSNDDLNFINGRKLRMKLVDCYFLRNECDPYSFDGFSWGAAGQIEQP